jgi:hypothetical protein
MEMARVVPRSAEIKEAAARMTKIVEAVNAYDARQELLAALKYARKCIAYCRQHHPDAQKGDGIPAEVFIDAAIAKAEGHPS